MQGYKTKNILGFDIFDGDKTALVSFLEDKMARQSQLCLFYANSNLLQHCQTSAADFQGEDIVIANDGIALDVVAYMLTGCRFTENLNGTDFTPYLLQNSQKCQRIFLLGGRPGVAEMAAHKFEERYGLTVVGWADGYTEINDFDQLVERINKSGAEVILVALGNPKQEQWILQHKGMLNVRMLIGVGALLDFVSGSVKRAPSFFRKCHLEWLYRLFGEPRRLFKRYTVEMIYFFFVCLKWQRKTRSLLQ